MMSRTGELLPGIGTTRNFKAVAPPRKQQQSRKAKPAALLDIIMSFFGDVACFEMGETSQRNPD